MAELLDKAQSIWVRQNEYFPRFEPCRTCEMESICASKCHVYQNTFESNEAMFYKRMCPFFKSELDLKLWREAARTNGAEQPLVQAPAQQAMRLADLE